MPRGTYCVGCPDNGRPSGKVPGPDRHLGDISLTCMHACLAIPESSEQERKIIIFTKAAVLGSREQEAQKPRSEIRPVI